MGGAGFELSYDLIVLDESESLMSHFDEGTMNKKEIEIVILQRDCEALKEWAATSVGDH